MYLYWYLLTVFYIIVESLQSDVCNPGFYYDNVKLKCAECPNGTYMDKIQDASNATNCYPHRDCNSDQIVEVSGTKISDVKCRCKDGYEIDESTETKCRAKKYVPTTFPPTTTTIATTATTSITTSTTPDTSKLSNGTIAAIVICPIVLIAVIGFVVAWVLCKKLRRRPPSQGDDIRLNEDKIPLKNGESTSTKLLKTDSILPDLSQKMIRDPFFWALLKEESAFSHSDQENALNMVSTKANTYIYDLAKKQKKKLEQLIYALEATDQDLADSLRKNLVEGIEIKKKDQSLWLDGQSSEKRIVNNFSRLVKKLTVNTEFLNHLRASDLFTETQYDEFSNKKTTIEKVDYILEWSMRGDPKKITYLIKALHETNQPLYAEFLSGVITAEEINKRIQ